MPPEVDNDTNITTFQMKDVHDLLRPEHELALAKFWSQEYNEAMHGNKAAQKWIKEALKEYARQERGEESPIAKQCLDGALLDLAVINPKAAKAFNDAIISHDGSIEFKHRHHK